MDYDPQGNQIELTSPNYLVDGPNKYEHFYSVFIVEYLLRHVSFSLLTFPKKPNKVEC